MAAQFIATVPLVLLVSDEVGYAKTAGSDTAQPRARQDVILVLGFFLGRLGRENIVALHKGHMRIPSDFSGVLFKPYVSGGDWPYKPTRELRESGYKVFANALWPLPFRVWSCTRLCLENTCRKTG